MRFTYHLWVLRSQRQILQVSELTMVKLPICLLYSSSTPINSLLHLLSLFIRATLHGNYDTYCSCIVFYDCWYALNCMIDQIEYTVFQSISICSALSLDALCEFLCLLRWPLHTSIHLRSQMGLDLGLKPSAKIKLLGVTVFLEIIKSPRKDSKNDHFYLQTRFILRQYFQFRSEPEVIYINIWTKLWLLFYWKSTNLPLSEMWKLFYQWVGEWVRF